MGLLQTLTFPGQKSPKILWKPELISGDECFPFETQASALGSPTVKGARRAVGKPTRAMRLPRRLAWGRHSGAQSRGHPPPRAWISEVGVHVGSLPAFRSRARFWAFALGCALRPHAAALSGVRRAQGTLPASPGLQAPGTETQGAEGPGPERHEDLHGKVASKGRRRREGPHPHRRQPAGLRLRLGGYQGNTTIFMTSRR